MANITEAKKHFGKKDRFSNLGRAITLAVVVAGCQPNIISTSPTERPSLGPTQSAEPSPTLISTPTFVPTENPTPIPTVEPTPKLAGIQAIIDNKLKPIDEDKLKQMIEEKYKGQIPNNDLLNMMIHLDNCYFDETFWSSCADLISQMYGSNKYDKDYLSTGDIEYLTLARELFNISKEKYPNREKSLEQALKDNFPS